ncbi:MAG: hypothetical protein ACI3WU_06255 [Phascolarctobacterium sp.]
MINSVKPILIEILKFFFIALCMAFSVVVVVLITSMDINALGSIPEDSLTERTQEALLAVSILLFAYRMRQAKAQGLWLVVGLLGCMLIREWDAVFDQLFHGAWKFFALPLALLCTYLALKNGLKEACQDIQDYFDTTSYKMLFAGLLVVLVVSRVVGMRLMVHIISGPHFHQSIKSFLEEGTELLGYIIIFSSSLCYCFAPSVALSFAKPKLKETSEYDKQSINCRSN